MAKEYIMFPLQNGILNFILDPNKPAKYVNIFPIWKQLFSLILLQNKPVTHKRQESILSREDNGPTTHKPWASCL